MHHPAVIMPGQYRHETVLGPLFLDHSLNDSDLNEIVCEMARRNLTPFDIVGATVTDTAIYFELREPLSSD